MLLKRIYERDAEGKPGRLAGIKLLRPDNGRHHFSPRFIARGEAQGWLEFSRDRIILKTLDGNVVYDVEREPGYYCCHCGKKLFENEGPTHLGEMHAGVRSPDPENPAGYRKDNYYDCVRRKGVFEKIREGI